jgi:hypothetical protein
MNISSSATLIINVCALCVASRPLVADCRIAVGRIGLVAGSCDLLSKTAVSAARRQRRLLLFAWLLYCSFVSSTAAALDVVVGVNVTGVQRLSEVQQDALIEDLQRDDVKVVRSGIGERFTHFNIRAYQRGIRVLVNVSPTQQGGTAHVRPPDRTLGLEWAELAITEADPAKFKDWLVAQLAVLEAAGVRLTAFELGNEINGPYFNGDFKPAQASGRELGLADLNNPDDAEGQAIAASYHAYLKVLVALKDVRDHSQLNQKTPIISAGLADSGPPGKRPGQKLGRRQHSRDP